MIVRYLTYIVFALMVVIAPKPAMAADSQVVISELSQGSSTSASEEFVELYNNSDQPINISGWSIYYRSATGTSWSKKAAIGSPVSLSPEQFFVASTGQPHNVVLISGMAQTGGVIELRDVSGKVIDTVGWGGASLSETKPASPSQAGESLYREYDTGTKQFVDSDNNFLDFYITDTLTPGAIPAIEAPDTSEPVDYPLISLYEVYPDPGDGQSDTVDEFIELYNPNTFDVDLSGWILKDSGGSSYIIKNITISANSYHAFYSGDTSLSLNNTGDTISLYSPAADLVDQSQDYGDAKEGLSWGVADGGWSWLTGPTPASSNATIYVAQVTTKPTASKTTKKAAVKKKAAAKKAATKKPKATKLKSQKAANTLASQDTAPSSLQSKLANYWPLLLIILGTATIGYGVYEYRPEITNTYYKLKDKLGSGR